MEQKELPSLEIAEANFKKELRTLSKNELVRQASNYYMRLTLAGFTIKEMQNQINKLTALSAQKSE